MNANDQPDEISSPTLAERLYNTLLKYLTPQEVEDYLSTPGLTIQDIANYVEKLKQEAAPVRKVNPYGLPQVSRRIVTDKLVFTPRGVYKEYKSK